jgi:hypothetical protein
LLGPAEDLTIREQRKTERLGDPALAEQAVHDFDALCRPRALLVQQLRQTRSLLTDHQRLRVFVLDERG